MLFTLLKSESICSLIVRDRLMDHPKGGTTMYLTLKTISLLKKNSMLCFLPFFVNYPSVTKHFTPSEKQNLFGRKTVSNL